MGEVMIMKFSLNMIQETEERLVNLTTMSIKSDILHETDFSAIIDDCCGKIEKRVWPLN